MLLPLEQPVELAPFPAPVKVDAFSAGADDCLTMPMDHAELVARIQAVTRRSRGFADPTIRVGALQLDTNTHQVCKRPAKAAAIA